MLKTELLGTVLEFAVNLPSGRRPKKDVHRDCYTMNKKSGVNPNWDWTPRASLRRPMGGRALPSVTLGAMPQKIF